MNNPSRRAQDIASEAEWNTRINLAASYRLIAHFGMSDLICNHTTARCAGQSYRVPDQPLRKVLAYGFR